MIIRPRGGDFLFDDDEFAVMQADIDAARDEGAGLWPGPSSFVRYGVVIGLLAADGTVDATRTHALIARARPLSVTFHRAFDMTPEPFEALETLVFGSFEVHTSRLGVDRVLTSGQEATVHFSEAAPHAFGGQRFRSGSLTNRLSALNRSEAAIFARAALPNGKSSGSSPCVSVTTSRRIYVLCQCGITKRGLR